MSKNPFQATSSSKKTLGRKIARIMGGCDSGSKDDPAQPPPNQPNPVMVFSKKIEEEVLERLSVKKECRAKAVLIHPYLIFNQVSSAINIEQKKEVEKIFASLMYYQSPETHLIRKEEGNSFSSIFLNWRRALTDLFSRYRSAVVQKKTFSFLVYIDGATCYFHVSGGSRCKNTCCSLEGYALYVSCKDKNHYVFSEKQFEKDEGGFCLNGKGVLFILDMIINIEISSVQAIPFVLSKHLFFHGIVVQPSISFQAEKRTGDQIYKVSVKGWVMGSDVQLLNESCFLQACIK